MVGRVVWLWGEVPKPETGDTQNQRNEEEQKEQGEKEECWSDICYDDTSKPIILQIYLLSNYYAIIYATQSSLLKVFPHHLSSRIPKQEIRYE